MLDTWKPEDVAVMQNIGNVKANEIYEGNMLYTLPVRATTDAAGTIKEQWIRAKYLYNLFFLFFFNIFSHLDLQIPLSHHKIILLFFSSLLIIL